MKEEKYVVDLSIYKNVIFLSKNLVFIEHDAQIGEGTIIEPNVMINKNSIIGKNNKIFAGAIIIDSQTSDNCIVGQYAILRGNVILKNNVTIGPHSEVSRSVFENNSGAFHKCVILDAHIYENAMLGAGVTTANTRHDGNRQKTIIKKNAKIGVNVSLVAPIVVAENAWVGAGSTITKDVCKNTTVIARCMQKKLDRR